jgi:hypothetical protein
MKLMKKVLGIAFLLYVSTAVVTSLVGMDIHTMFQGNGTQHSHHRPSHNQGEEGCHA